MSSDRAISVFEPSRRVLVMASAWLAGTAALAYALDCGQGFIKDDYRWISTSQLRGWPDVCRLFTSAPMGFYRPLVSLSFGLNEWMSGLNPLPYGLTNLALVLVTAGMIAALARRLGLSWGAALFGAGVWVFNFHGINMAVLWISGRTSLLGTLWAVAAAWAFAGKRFLVAGVLSAMALFSKEEPILLPVVLASWTLIDHRTSGPTQIGHTLRAMVRAAWPSCAAGVLYLAVRVSTDALTPGTAPVFYRLSIDAIGSNWLQYLDRALTFPTALLVLGMFAVTRRDFHLTPLERSIVMKGSVWLVLGFALTIMVPVRSSLYVCLPSVGSALVAAAVGSAEWRAMRRRPVIVAALLVGPLALLPVYRARNSRLRNEARLAAESLDTIARRVSVNRPSRLVVYDDPSVRPSILDAFGDSLPDAIRLFVPGTNGMEVRVLPSTEAVPGQGEPDSVTLALRDGRLVDAATP
jgi:hypothetical protein